MAEALPADADLVHRANPITFVGSGLQQAWWLALGLFATVVEQTARVADGLVEKGREVEPSILKPIRRGVGDAGTRLRVAASRVDLPLVLHRAGPTRQQFEKLAEEVRELRDKIGEEATELKKSD